tara:strand:- start:5520 stop:6212 length:693 start_codon:yes stop_codon:yes gene_type:complete
MSEHTTEEHTLIFVILTGVFNKFKLNKQECPKILIEGLLHHSKFILDKRIVKNRNKYYEQILKATPTIIVDVEREYKKFKDSFKKTGNIDYVNVSTPFDKKRNNSSEYFELFMSERQGDKIMTYNLQVSEWNWIDYKLYAEQFKLYRKAIKEKKLIAKESEKDTCQALDKNQKLVGKKWYSLTITINGDNNLLCVGSLEVFGKIKAGFVYYFYDEKDRDNAFNYLNGIKI